MRIGMICLESYSPSLGSDLPLYREVGWVEGLATAWMDLDIVVEPKKLWALSDCSILTR
jgi:hypothetical protein